MFLWFCSHLYLKKCQTILLVQVSSYNIFSIKTFRDLMEINDCFFVLHHHHFALFLPRICTELLIYGEGSARRGVCASSQWALCVYDEGRGWKGDLGRQQVCFFSVQTSSRQAINRGDREKQWRALWFWFTPMLKNPNKLEEQNNTQQEINHINDEALNDSQTWKRVAAGASGGEDGRLWEDIRSRLQRKAENNQVPAVTRRRSLFFPSLGN